MLAGAPPPGAAGEVDEQRDVLAPQDRKSTRLNSSHSQISYAVFCLKKKKKEVISSSRYDQSTYMWFKCRRRSILLSLSVALYSSSSSFVLSCSLLFRHYSYNQQTT